MLCGDLRGRRPSRLSCAIQQACIEQLNADQKTIDAFGKKLGNYVGQSVYGGQVATAQADVTDLKKINHNDNRELAKEMRGMRAELPKAVNEIAKHPVLVIADGKVIARVVDEENAKTASHG